MTTPEVYVYYASQKGTAKKYTFDLASRLREKLGDVVVTVRNLKESQFDDYLKGIASINLFVTSTYQDGIPPPSASAWFVDLKNALRIAQLQTPPATKGDVQSLTGQWHGVFGVGDRAYKAAFNAAAFLLDSSLSSLGSQQLRPVGLCDVNGPTAATTFDRWATVVVALVRRRVKEALTLVGKASLADNGVESDADADGDVVEDVEDLVVAGGAGGAPGKSLLTPHLGKALSKQGYKLVGSHSAVKMCRWTKSMLRGRGGCYKHTFYGISSHQCMEMTPSLACANKCVFCWRQHTNPVTTSWRWVEDPPEDVVGGVLASHRAMIREFRGAAGVLPERLVEGMNPRHCALSLVGEPIIYPQINRLLQCLHERKISSFLVTNAQFPEPIRNLVPVTQLYVSIDAPDRESLKAVDQPLFEDFWERFLECIDLMRDKRIRTVYRLTLVKAWNMDEVAKYAELVRRGQPCFIEMKGVTWCGSDSLSMDNVPYHHEVLAFSHALCAALPAGEYEVAAQHEHSCSVMLAHTRFRRDGVWYTHIDFDKFIELVEAGADFGAEDYLAPTPDWALIDAPEKGFDPAEMRWKAKGKGPKGKVLPDGSIEQPGGAVDVDGDGQSD